MPQIKVAVSLCGVNVAFKQALHIVRSVGADAVEIDARGGFNPRDLSGTGVRQVRKMLDDLNLRVAAVRFATRYGYEHAEGLERRVEATKAAMRLASALGARVVVNQVGLMPADADSASFRLLVEVLADLGRYGQHAGAYLAAETGSEHGADLKRLLAALPAGSLCVALNPGKLIVNGFAPSEAIAELGSDILYVRAQDGVRDRATGRGMEVQLGRGSADLPALMGALEERGYRGDWCVVRPFTAESWQEVAQAVSYLKSL